MENNVFERYKKIILSDLKNIFENNIIIKSTMESPSQLYTESLQSFAKYEDIYNYLANEIIKELNKHKISKPNFNLYESNVDVFFDKLRDNIDKDMYMFFLKEIVNDKISFVQYKEKYNIKNLSLLSNGKCLPVDSSSYYYLINRNEKLYYYNFFAVIHELTHGYVNSRISNTCNNSIFSEVYSIFNELKLYSLSNNDKSLENDVNLYKYYIILKLLQNSKLITYLKQLENCIDSDSFDENKVKKTINKYKFDKKLLKQYKLDISFYSEIPKYFIGTIIAIELYYQDLIDPEKAEYNLNKIYSNDYNTLYDLKKLNSFDLEAMKSGENVKKLINEMYNK